MAWYGMKRHAVAHHYMKDKSHSIIPYSTYTLIDVFPQPEICYVSGRFMSHIWTMEVTYLNNCCIIWTMEGTYLDEWYISGRWRLHIWTTGTYLDGGGYISGRLVHIWMVEVAYLVDWYISGWWRLHIMTTGTYLDVTYLHVTRRVYPN